ncbi:uncharacterized protein LOC109604082 isoform X4 [Aethina tumida]|uniref:uncharacterized protein LOC109604082 isoform X2 n=1 Tax=Aethina tumida TaxID=116153 RepID=UPI002148AE0C|nr:uncharacterized protein LOC109604082 isoform X2 [Aethina tumida]XP_049824845.1 uncharacterized protein LOC109604082 isoform X3 [Aethina tumida]XP_049824846.1 uncharacterized protein LOC109604082 isoform X4 [Aethina tumida]
MKYVVLIYCICSLVYDCRCLMGCSDSLENDEDDCLNRPNNLYKEMKYRLMINYWGSLDDYIDLEDQYEEQDESYLTEYEYHECSDEVQDYDYFDNLYRRKRYIFKQRCSKCNRDEVRICRNQCYCKKRFNFHN